jgi:hypothetical protein
MPFLVVFILYAVYMLILVYFLIIISQYPNPTLCVFCRPVASAVVLHEGWELVSESAMSPISPLYLLYLHLFYYILYPIYYILYPINPNPINPIYGDIHTHSIYHAYTCGIITVIFIIYIEIYILSILYYPFP